ncbi:TPA: cold shock domain-containing protein [Candidatus Woesearchaeota archaeon]|nr:cold shock domain-containing protein [Candidatus Woesearchaeota archaeon]
MVEGTKLSGTVKWFDGQKGYGFIQGEDGKDYFVHASFLPEGLRLNEGDAVVFVPTKDDNGRTQAKEIEKQ